MMFNVRDRVTRVYDGSLGVVVSVDPDPNDDYPYRVDWEGDSIIWMRGNEIVLAPDSTRSAEDRVNHPSHYNSGKIEVIDFIEDQNLEYHESNALKYISRAGKKNPGTRVEDLEKAVWYLNRKIALLKGENDG